MGVVVQGNGAFRGLSRDSVRGREERGGSREMLMGMGGGVGLRGMEGKGRRAQVIGGRIGAVRRAVGSGKLKDQMSVVPFASRAVLTNGCVWAREG